MHGRVNDFRGPAAVFIGHIVGVVHQLVQLVLTNFFITDVDLSIKPGKVDIDPVGIFRFSLKEGGILNDGSINRIFKGVRIAGLLEHLVFMFGKINFKISGGLGNIRTIAGE